MNKTNKILTFSASYLAKLAILTGTSFLLYFYGKFSLPFMFPSFLDFQLSELPALLAGFSMGPFSGCLVIVLKCLIKFPFSSTNFVGELTDIIIGIAMVLPASIIYYKKKDKKHALIGLSVGFFTFVLAAVIINRFVSIPFYTRFFFNGDFQILINMLSALYPKINAENFYVYYLLLGIVPFNILRGALVAALTFLLYKRLSRLLHWEGTKITKINECNVRNSEFRSHSVSDTYFLAKTLAKTLQGGEMIVLEGDLGAGKTTFTKGLAIALGISEDLVNSPTFTIMKEYDGKLKLYHYDMYRLENSAEVGELGLEENFNDPDGVCVIEWNKFDNLKNVIKVKIEKEGKNSRKITIGELQ
ncbi:MAG TPA: tRNA (adenosine(37)-N6)-threonylcarbamoyltransferase complex ATPase subunit type 1 TsaE [Clostridia bacterium]|mgnify:CR=1 FL=1|nr:tRNA (adenosine(37)-N6)-threonylcarbamoyltransferase complex ATPase subunit type 1 TsaE [Clostridia bacterium]